MRNKWRRWAERLSLTLMAALGVVVLVADVLGLDRFLPAGAIPKITLLVLSTVTLFLLLEVERFQSLDNIDARLAELDIDSIAQKMKRDRYAGIVTVHPCFPEDLFKERVASAREVTILNTWIPNLQRFEDVLVDALKRDAAVRVLLLYPNSGVAQLRDEALRAVRDPSLADNVKDGVMRCLAILESVAKNAATGNGTRPRLQVKVYNSLPSISVYRADGHYLVSTFLHGQLAIDSPQFDLDGADTVLGRQIQRELDTLWEIGCQIDLMNWREHLKSMVL